jgi:hypothetical protein
MIARLTGIHLGEPCRWMASFANRFSRIREAGKPITLSKLHGVATVALHVVSYQLGVRHTLAVDEAMEPLQFAAMSVRALWRFAYPNNSVDSVHYSALVASYQN